MSVCIAEVPWSYKLGYFENTVITRLISLRSSLLGAPTSAI